MMSVKVFREDKKGRNEGAKLTVYVIVFVQAFKNIE